MSIINPYNNVNWGTFIQVPSVSHQHGRLQATFEELLQSGLKHFCLSNYHPSEPWYPLDAHFVNIPQDVLGSPNAEFYQTQFNHFHHNGIGSTFSYPEDAPNRDWRKNFDDVLANLIFEDAGGITLNHLNWTRWSSEYGSSSYLYDKDIFEMIDYDERVLGIEYLNTNAEIGDGHGYDFELWDKILLTGRRCWGFCVSDHLTEWNGRNILLCSEFTEHECLKAYREGRFYGKVFNTDLAFDSISLDGHTINVSASNADNIKIIVDGTPTTIQGNSAEFVVPDSAVYARVEAHSEDNSIYSQPFIFKPYTKKSVNTAKKMLILGL